MKKSELKKVLKPVIKECINEILLEEGLLSGVVSEVVKGLGTQTIVEQRPLQTSQVAEPNTVPEMGNLKEHRAQMLKAVTKDAYNGVDLFEGTEPLSSYESQSPKKGSVDLGDPRDAGVDISSLVGMSSKIWQAMK